jgi:ferredoxin-NADP reductase
MIAMIDYQSTLLARTEVAEGTMAFQFERPNHFVFKAGQQIDLALPSQPGLPNGRTHTLSIASSPSDEELVVTTRMRDTVFKQAMSILPIGSRATIEGSHGLFYPPQKYN